MWGILVLDSNDSNQANALCTSQLEGKERLAKNIFQMCAQAFVEWDIANSHWDQSETWGKVICHLTHFLTVSHLVLFICFHSAMEKEMHLGIYFLSLVAQIYWSGNSIHPMRWS